MAENKTKPTGRSVADYLKAIPDPTRREDCITLIGIMNELTGEKPKLWGPSMIGFGTRHYKYESGREGDIFAAGFASRKPDLVLYMGCFGGLPTDAVARLGKCKSGKGCLYIRSLKDIDLAVLRKMLSDGFRDANGRPVAGMEKPAKKKATKPRRTAARKTES
jgi:hypothetical protein